MEELESLWLTMENPGSARSTVCASCLSTNRRLWPLREIMEVADLYVYVSNGIHLSHEDYVCWECKAILHKFCRFRSMALKARDTLATWLQHQMSNQHLDKLQSLSTLSLSKLSKVDIPNMRIKQERKVDLETVKMVEDDKMVEIEKEFIDQQVKQEKEEDPDPPAEGSVDMDEDTDAHTEFTVKQMSEMEMLSYRECERDRFRYKNSPYKCQDCVKFFRNEAAMSRHLQLHQENKDGLPCAVCSLRFPCQTSLALHLQSHYSCYECTNCGYKNANRSAILAHCWRHHKATKKCSICKLEFISSVQLNAHLSQSHREDVTCRSCGRGYRNKYLLRRHEAMIHSVDVPLLECDVCNKKFRGENRLKAHKRIHDLNRANENAYCAECDVQFKNIYLYHVHLKTTARHVAPTDRKFECSDCGKRFISKPYLKLHIELVHLRKENYVCDICGQGFNARLMLSRHKREKHTNRVRNKILCDICGKGFTVRKCLLEHKNTHSGARPFECRLCSATFSYSAALYNHNKLVHLKIARPRKNGNKLITGL